MLVHQFLENSAERRPDHVAIVHGATRVAYAEVEQTSNRIANVLMAQGIVRGDRVAILLENSYSYIAAYYGILKTGAITVPLFQSTNDGVLLYTLSQCNAKAIILNDRSTKLLERCLPRLKDLGIVIHEGRMPPKGLPSQVILSWNHICETAETARPDRSIIDIDAASIIYTSGSTGSPKGVTLSHLNIVSNTRSIVEYANLEAGDSIMVVMPFPYVFGKSLLNTHFYVGGTVVIDNRFVFPNAVLETMHKEQVTGFAGVPFIYATLLNKSKLCQYSWEHLRYIMQAGGSLAPALIKKLMAALPRTDIYIMYGATEASARLSYLPPIDLVRKLGSVGRAIPNVELKIIKEDGCEAKSGEVGEVVARGSNIMLGYWNDPEETQRVMRQNCYLTGDLGYRDDEGYIYIVGRTKEMIKTAGYRISPKEIEETLLEHADISEAAVIGVPDESLGEKVRAYVVQHPQEPKHGPPLTEMDVVQFCRQRLPPHKVPGEVRLVSELPKSEAGKIQKQALKTNH
ncbi:MAG: class I adenylate-forming enzyme family protein [Syntrophales bacterium]